MSVCPVCGHPGGACTGTQRTNRRQIITTDGIVRRSGPERLPRVRSRLGRAGYVGEGTGAIDVYDPKYPNVRLVDEKADEPNEDRGATEEIGTSDSSDAKLKAPRTRRKKADDA